ncbi:MAG: hypothetical protein ACXVW0_09185 [Nocardioides sp.]
MRTTLAAATLSMVCALAPAAQAGTTGPVQAPSSITMGTPTAQRVKAGAKVTVTGQVVGGTDRTVVAELRTAAGWMRLYPTHATTDMTGAYTLRVPTDWFYRGAIRTSVLPTDAFAGASSSTTAAMAVRPAYTPQGRATDWTLLTRGARWNPCQVTTYVVNTAAAPPHALSWVKQAFLRLHQATGLRFAYAGSTTAIPYRSDGNGSQYGDAPITIAWSTERLVSALLGTSIGYGGNSSTGDAIVQGGVVLDRAAHLTGGFGKGATWGTLILHELGHVMGLNHAQGAVEVMHSGVTSQSRGRYQAGDLTGLRKLGALGGCTTQQSLRQREQSVASGR